MTCLMSSKIASTIQWNFCLQNRKKIRTKEEVEKGEREIRLTKGIENKAILIIN